MPDIKNDNTFAHLDGMEFSQLHARMQEIKGSKENMEDLTDEAVSEIVAILARLRSKSSGPPKKAKTKAASTSVTIDAL